MVLSVIEEGYKLEFIQKPPQTNIKQTSVPNQDLDLLKLEVEELFKKRYRNCSVERDKFRFLHHPFPRTKKEGKMRSVINLRPLNRHLQTTHFKMDTMTKDLNF